MVRLDPVGPVGTPVEETKGGDGQLPGEHVQAARRGLPGGGDQVGALYLTPVQCLVQGQETEWLTARFEGSQLDLVVVRRHHARHGINGVQIPGEHPAHGTVPLPRSLLQVRPAGRVGPQQVVEPVAVGGRRLQQLGIHQLLQGIRDASLGLPHERGRGGQPDRPPLPRSQQAERMRRVNIRPPSRRGRLAKLTSKQARTARSPVFSSSSRRRSSESRRPGYERSSRPARPAGHPRS